MKKALFVLLSLAVAAIIYTDIAGSPHDFSALGWNGGGEICEPCHIPHNADTTVSGAPLWNHTLSTAGIYTLYSNAATMDSTPAQPGGVSRLCLSCHDGTVALDSFGGVVGATTIGGVRLVGTDLSNDHPIAITYNAALATADGGLFDPTATGSGIIGSTGDIDDDMLFGAANDQLECASCHDVHDDLDGGTAGNLLRKSNAVSALCLTCHDK